MDVLVLPDEVSSQGNPYRIDATNIKYGNSIVVLKLFRALDTPLHSSVNVLRYLAYRYLQTWRTYTMDTVGATGCVSAARLTGAAGATDASLRSLQACAHTPWALWALRDASLRLGSRALRVLRMRLCGPCRHAHIPHGHCGRYGMRLCGSAHGRCGCYGCVSAVPAGMRTYPMGTVGATGCVSAARLTGAAGATDASLRSLQTLRTYTTDAVGMPMDTTVDA